MSNVAIRGRVKIKRPINAGLPAIAPEISLRVEITGIDSEITRFRRQRRYAPERGERLLLHRCVIGQRHILQEGRWSAVGDLGSVVSRLSLAADDIPLEMAAYQDAVAV